MNGVGTLADKKLKELNKLAEKYGLKPLKDQKKDLPHFSSDPTKHGYKSLKDAVEENLKDYKEKTKPKPKEPEQPKTPETKVDLNTNIYELLYRGRF